MWWNRGVFESLVGHLFSDKNIYIYISYIYIPNGSLKSVFQRKWPFHFYRLTIFRYTACNHCCANFCVSTLYVTATEKKMQRQNTYEYSYTHKKTMQFCDDNPIWCWAMFSLRRRLSVNLNFKFRFIFLGCRWCFLKWINMMFSLTRISNEPIGNNAYINHDDDDDDMMMCQQRNVWFVKLKFQFHSFSCWQIHSNQRNKNKKKTP